MNFSDDLNDWRTYEPLFDLEIPDGSTAEYISDLVESFDKYKSTAMLYASLKPKEDGTLFGKSGRLPSSFNSTEKSKPSWGDTAHDVGDGIGNTTREVGDGIRITAEEGYELIKD
ncbi:hypothetical protein ACTFIT_008146 [Dictyostelium discoideum]